MKCYKLTDQNFETRNGFIPRTALKNKSGAINGALGALTDWLRADELGYCAKELRAASLERLLTEAVNEHAALCRVAEALEDAEWLLRKLSVNWKEAGAMRESAARSADDARETLQSLTTLRASVGGKP